MTARSKGPRLSLLAVAMLGLALALTGCGAAATKPTASADKLTTAVVRQGDLDQTLTKPGTLGYGTAKPLLSGLSGTITGLPRVGTTLGQGSVAYDVNTQPVVHFAGAMPAWRALGPGVTDGEDVKQLEAGLVDLGFGAGLTVDDHWTDGTTAAVKAWQKKLGVEPTGTLPFGQVIFTPTPIRVDSLTVAVGDPIAVGGAVLSVNKTSKVVTTTLGASDKAIAHVGAKVNLLFDDGHTESGTVQAVTLVPGDEAQSKPDTLAVTVKVPDSAWIRRQSGDVPVTVKLTHVAAKSVLIVPVTALVPLANGSYGVQKLIGSSTSYVTVVPGTFSDTDVAVTSPDLKAGDKVVVTP